MFKRLVEEIHSIKRRDPAARSTIEVLLCYPGLKAVLLHRVAHALWMWNWRITARILSGFSRFITGIEIHPGAKIGEHVFIDHGMGVVIGETATIGNNVTLYHGVTLGGTGADSGKRHPDIGNDVVIGAGAKVLGAITVGDGARVGANAVVVRNVAPGESVVGVPAHRIASAPPAFVAYGTSPDMPDPLEEEIIKLREEIRTLKAEISSRQTRFSAEP
jgi:serine O-acetyltransferase